MAKQFQNPSLNYDVLNYDVRKLITVHFWHKHCDTIRHPGNNVTFENKKTPTIIP